MDNWQVRLWQAEDVQVIAQIEDDQGFSRWSCKQLDESLQQHSCYLLEKEKAIAGYAIFSQVIDEVELLNITFDRRYQGKGLATCLLRSCLLLFKQQGAKNCFLEVGEKNHGAIKLYRQVGFQSVGCRKKYYRTQQPMQDALIFRLAL